MNWLTSLISPVANIAGQIIKNRNEISKAKHQAQMQTIQNNADWEAKMADASANSWKDEFWTLVLSAPIFMISYSIIVDDPSVIDRTKQAFTVLSELPEWYQYLLFVCISASFGIKGVDRLLSLKKK